MISRREFVGAAGALTILSSAALADVLTGQFLETYPLLVSMAPTILVGFDGSTIYRSASEGRVMGISPGELLERKESQCRDLAMHCADIRHLYATLNAADFRSGRVLQLAGITFSEIDVALMLALE